MAIGKMNRKTSAPKDDGSLEKLAILAASVPDAKPGKAIKPRMVFTTSPIFSFPVIIQIVCAVAKTTVTKVPKQIPLKNGVIAPLK